MPEEELNQELSSDELKDAVGGMTALGGLAALFRQRGNFRKNTQVPNFIPDGRNDGK